MREKNTKIKKSIFRIAIFSVGGVIAIFCLMFVISFLFRLHDDLSKYLPYFFGIVLILCIVLSLYFLSIKPLCYIAKSRHFVKSRKMTKEEKIIHNIKTYMNQGKKSRIAGMTCFLFFIVSCSILIMSMGNKLAETMTGDQIEVLVAAKLLVVHYLFGIFMGFIAFLILDEFAGFTRNKHKLTVNMWDRIQELESEVKKLKAGAQVDGQ
jgi:flagellar biosynthesis protein FlhB